MLKNCDLIVPSDGLGLDSACFDRLIPLQPCVGCCCCCLFTAGSLQTLCCCPLPANTEGRTRGRVSIAVATPSTIRAPECGNDKRGPWLSVISSISIYHHHAVTHSGERCRVPRRHTSGGRASSGGAFRSAEMFLLWLSRFLHTPPPPPPPPPPPAIARVRGCLGGAACGESAVCHTAL